MMKKQLKTGSLIALFPALLIVLCACVMTTQVNSKESKSSDENGSSLEADIPSITIQHFDLDAGNENMEFFYEIPSMEGITPAAKCFNDFFNALYEDFMATEPEKVRELLDAAALGRPSTDDPYRYCWRAEVQEVSEQWVSVTMSYDWYMGGVWDYGVNGYTFDCETGERLLLTDVLQGPEEMIQAAIADGLKAQYPRIVEVTDDQGNTPLTALEKIPVRDIDFYVAKDGTVTVVFDKYEIAPGVAGMLISELNG